MASSLRGSGYLLPRSQILFEKPKEGSSANPSLQSALRLSRSALPMDAARKHALSLEEFDRELTAIQGPMGGYVISLLGPGADTDDIVQETNLFLFERKDDFVPGTSFKAWAFRVAYFKALACRRDRIRRDESVFSEATIHLIAERSSTLFGDGEDRLTALRDCLDQLPKTERSLLAARYQNHSTLTKFAKTQDRTESSIYKAISRLRLALRHCIEGRMNKL